MILKGNIRAAGQELANHLLNARDNDRVELAGLHGFAGDTLHKALAETEAIASATNCRKYLYSLSINPSQPMTRAQYEAAIDRIGPEFHELSGRAKDLGSAAVMLALIIAGGTWLTFLYERFTGS